jgi:integrase
VKTIINISIPQYLTSSPLKGVKIVKSKLPAKRTLNADEEAAFAAALKGIDLELHDMYLVGLGTLLRRENIYNLQRKAHRRDRLVLDTKAGPHQIPLLGPTELQQRANEILLARMPADPEGYFFPKWQAVFAKYAAKKESNQNGAGCLFLKKVQRAAKAVGVPWGLKKDGVVWHTLTRASGATRLLRDYHVDMRSVQYIGHWASLDQMSTYLGVDNEALFAPIASLPPIAPEAPAAAAPAAVESTHLAHNMRLVVNN